MEEVKQEEQQDLIEKVVYVNRVAKVVKGGRQFSFSAIVVVGDGETKVGWGFGKAKEIAEAIRKASVNARKDMFKVPKQGGTIPHQIVGKYGAGKVLLKPAKEGTGIIAGGPVRAICEAAGIRDILTKCLNSTNPVNVVKACISGLKNLKSSDYRKQINRTSEEKKDRKLNHEDK